MSADRVPGAVLPLLYVLAGLLLLAAGTWRLVRRERRNPTAYSRRPDVLASWKALSTEEQAAVDGAALDANEAAEDAVRRAVDTELQAAVDAAKRNALFHP